MFSKIITAVVTTACFLAVLAIAFTDSQVGTTWKVGLVAIFFLIPIMDGIRKRKDLEVNLRLRDAVFQIVKEGGANLRNAYDQAVSRNEALEEGRVRSAEKIVHLKERAIQTAEALNEQSARTRELLAALEVLVDERSGTSPKFVTRSLPVIQKEVLALCRGFGEVRVVEEITDWCTSRPDQFLKRGEDGEPLSWKELGRQVWVRYDEARKK